MILNLLYDLSLLNIQTTTENGHWAGYWCDMLTCDLEVFECFSVCGSVFCVDCIANGRA